MKNHKFMDTEVLMLSRQIGERFKRKKWMEFVCVAKTLGFEVRPTGGRFLTHEINANEEEFNVLLELLV